MREGGTHRLVCVKRTGAILIGATYVNVARKTLI